MKLITLRQITSLAAFLALAAFGETATSLGVPVQTVLVSATSNRAEATVRLFGIAKLEAKDLQYTVTSADERGLTAVTIEAITAVPNSTEEWTLTLRAERLISFGETVVTLSYLGVPKQAVRFFRPGLVVKTPENGFTVKEGGGTPFTIVLENPVAIKYSVVRARLRFHDKDVCVGTTDNSLDTKPVLIGWDKFVAWFCASGNKECNDPQQWAKFPVAEYTSTTFRAKADSSWFRDPQSGYPKSAKRKGILTLRYDNPEVPKVNYKAAADAVPAKAAVPATAATAAVPATAAAPATPEVLAQDIIKAGTMIFEQNIPLEVQFEPSGVSTLFTLLEIFSGLLIGAVLLLSLRVTIPNYRRKRAIKEQFAQAAKATRGISGGVSSVLRVLLRVERLALQSNLRAAWIFGPAFAEVAQRVELGMKTTNRKIEIAKRLDAARNRQCSLAGQDAPPTRLDKIDRHIAAATDALLREQLGEQDWVFIQEQLDAVDKLLGEPTQEEKDAFEVELVQRWKSIRNFFETEPDTNVNNPPTVRLKVPAALVGMEDCFPSAKGLPSPVDTSDGSQWVKDIGPARADLQLSALSMLRQFQFLLPSTTTGWQIEPWATAKSRLITLLQTPSTENLAVARLLLRQLAPNISVSAIEDALRAGEADIEVEPQRVFQNEKTRLVLRFRNPDFKSAAARLALECVWTLTDKRADIPPIDRWWKKYRYLSKRKAQSPEIQQIERGWEIYRYFENDVKECEITVRFYNQGKLLTKPGAGADGDLIPAEPVVISGKVTPEPQENRSYRWWHPKSEQFQRFTPEALQLGAALLVPLATLAVTQSGEVNSGNFRDLIGLGFGSEAIRGILTPTPEQSGGSAQPPK